MGIVIPPSMKAIIGMTTCPVSLLVRIWFEEQYSRPTPCGIRYLALKPSMPAGEFTRLLNLPILLTLSGTEKGLLMKEGRGEQQRRRVREYGEMNTYRKREF